MHHFRRHPYLRRQFLTLGTAALSLAAVRSVHAGPPQVSVNPKGVAIGGYDTTAYLRTGVPVEGAVDHVVMWRGVPWQFASAEDAASFREAPEDFAPQFGGFCTRAMSFGKVVNGDPTVWRLHQGSLYLFAKPVGAKKFDEGPDAMIIKARRAWARLG